MVAASMPRQAAYIRDEFAVNPADAAAYPFLFCRLCQYAVLVPSITDHIKDMHNSIPTRQRRVVRKVASQLPGMYQSKEDAKHFQLPNHHAAPIPHIRPPARNGRQCLDCQWITTSRLRARMHTHEPVGSSPHESRWRDGVWCQQLFARGPRSVWFEVAPEQRSDAVSSPDQNSVVEDAGSLLQRVHPSRDSYLPGQYDIESQQSERAPSPADTPSANTAESIAMDEPDHHADEIEPIPAGAQPEDGAKPQVDASWVAIQTLRVPCVLCTVRTFRARCTRDMEGPGTGREEAPRQSLDDETRCGWCGLREDWDSVDVDASGFPDERLRSEDLLYWARIAALWIRMGSSGAQTSGFTLEKLAGACLHLTASTEGNGTARTARTAHTHITRTPHNRSSSAQQDLASDTPPERLEAFQTPQARTAIVQHGQITPPDEVDFGFDAFEEDDFLLLPAEPDLATDPAAAGARRKRAGTDTTDPSRQKMAKRGSEHHPVPICSSPLARQSKHSIPATGNVSLFHDAIARETEWREGGVWHAEISPQEQDVFRTWLEGYQTGDSRSKAAAFRRLHSSWRGRCAVCWFSPEGRPRQATAPHAPDACPRQGSRPWALARMHEELMRDLVLTKELAGRARQGWDVGSGCWRCGLPAWRCESFEHIPGRFFRPRVPEGSCQDERLLRHVAASVLAGSRVGAACVVARVKISWAKERTDLASREGIAWLQDNTEWTKPECSFFALLVFELERFGQIMRSRLS